TVSTAHLGSSSAAQNAIKSANMDAAYVLSEKISSTTVSRSSQSGFLRSQLRNGTLTTAVFISSRAHRRRGSLRTPWNGSLRIHANRLLEQERRVLREKQYRWCQSRGQTPDRCGSTKMLRSEPGRLPRAPPGIVRISWRGDRPMCCPTGSS